MTSSECGRLGGCHAEAVVSPRPIPQIREAQARRDRNREIPAGYGGIPQGTAFTRFHLAGGPGDLAELALHVAGDASADAVSGELFVESAPGVKDAGMMDDFVAEIASRVATANSLTYSFMGGYFVCMLILMALIRWYWIPHVLKDWRSFKELLSIMNDDILNTMLLKSIFKNSSMAQ